MRCGPGICGFSAAGEPEPVTPTPERVRSVVDRYVEASNCNDKAAVLALFASDAVWHDPVGQPPHVGHDEIGQFFDDARALADRIEMVTRDVIVCADEAVLLFEIHATIGDQTMVMDVVEVFEIDADERIATAKAYWDMSRARARGA
jgi:steroid delta-isomerase